MHCHVYPIGLMCCFPLTSSIIIELTVQTKKIKKKKKKKSWDFSHQLIHVRLAILPAFFYASTEFPLCHMNIIADESVFTTPRINAWLCGIQPHPLQSPSPLPPPTHCFTVAVALKLKLSGFVPLNIFINSFFLNKYVVDQYVQASTETQTENEAGQEKHLIGAN